MFCLTFPRFCHPGTALMCQPLHALPRYDPKAPPEVASLLQPGRGKAWRRPSTPLDRKNPDTRRPAKPRSVRPPRALISLVSRDCICSRILLIRKNVKTPAATSPLAWTARVAGGTTCSSSVSGKRPDTRRSILGPTTRRVKRAPRSRATSGSTAAGARTRHSPIAHPMRHTSRRGS